MNEAANQAAATGAGAAGFVFWLVLMAAVVGITSYICYVAWQGNRQMHQRERDVARGSERKPEPGE